MISTSPYVGTLQSVTYNGRKYNSRSDNNIFYATPLPCDLSTATSIQLKPRPAILHNFVAHAFHANDTVYEHVFASVSWLKEHPAKDTVGKPMEIWWKDLNDDKLEPFIPLQFLICHSIFMNTSHEGQTVYLMCPIHNIRNFQSS